MERIPFTPRTAVVVGASGQDGYFLTRRLLADGWRVCATARRLEPLRALAGGPHGARLSLHRVELAEPSNLFELVARERPEEVYNLAGQSSVSRSFAEPHETWRTNAEFVAGLLESLRLHSPATRLYQASSTDMFGGATGPVIFYDEDSPLDPQSPYASAKAAAHLLCHSYRAAYNLRVACGVLSNHESRLRPAHFLTRKITDHVRALRRGVRAGEPPGPPLRVGHLKVRRDWGFAPDYVEGMRLILRQISVRAARQAAAERGDARPPSEASHAPADAPADEGRNYRDYVLGTGRAHAVWELIDVAFRLAGFALEWHLDGDDPAGWHARFRATGDRAVVSDASLLRPADPLVISVDASRARRELGWSPREGLEVFLSDMLEEDGEAWAGGEGARTA
ncbi:MAG TPA: GDP-mannose 4,6-dehydratase [Pyrinomonadaceae bacterium]|nr:GDP-mannose 4,6-dehydratase [Pyrinomonadaceae bacterium]